jgi:hypothetical protein
MKKIYCLLFVLFIIITCTKLHGASYVSIATGSWTDPAVWSLPWVGAPVPPQASQPVVISAGTTITGTTSNNYSLDVYGTLIFTGSYNISGCSIVVEDGGTFIINGDLTSTINITLNGSAKLMVKGNLNESGGNIYLNNTSILVVGQNFNEGNMTTILNNNATVLVVGNYTGTNSMTKNGLGTEIAVLGSVTGSIAAYNNCIPTPDPAWNFWSDGVNDYWTGSSDTNWANTANWSLGTLPVSGGNVDFNSTVSHDLVLDADRKIGYLTVTSGHRVVVPAGKCLTVNGTITTTNDPNQIYVQSSSSGASGSLIFHNASGSPVQGTVDMYSLASWNLANPVGAKYKWQFFAIPVQSLSTVSPTFDGSYVREMHESDSPAHWYQLNNSSSMTSFHGYEITQAAGTTYTYQGALENRDYLATLSYTSGASYPGESLIGNSYTAAIYIKNLVFGSDMLATVYLYNTGTEADWLANGKTPVDSTNTLAGQYTAVPFALAGTGTLPGQIPSMQAFLVKAKKSSSYATLSIPYSTTTTMVKNTDKQRSIALKNNVRQLAEGTVKINDSIPVWTQIDVKGSVFSDRMWIFSDSICTHSFDNGYDGEKFIGSYVSPQIYAMEADGIYQVNSVDDMNNTYLGFQPGEDSIYTMTFTHQNLNLMYSGAYLLDSLRGTTTDITASGSTYTFQVLAADTIEKRFKIVTIPAVTTGVQKPVISGNTLNVFSSQKTIFVDNKGDQSGYLQIYDIAGRFIQKYPFAANEVTTLRTGLSPGVYVTTAITKTDKTTTRLMVH